jgi:hypothetical protein
MYCGVPMLDVLHLGLVFRPGITCGASLLRKGLYKGQAHCRGHEATGPHPSTWGVRCPRPIQPSRSRLLCHAHLDQYHYSSFWQPCRLRAAVLPWTQRDTPTVRSAWMSVTAPGEVSMTIWSQLHKDVNYEWHAHRMEQGFL